MIKPSRIKPQSTWRIFRWPLLVNLVSILGLLAALIGNGWLDFLSWLCLGSLLVLMYWAVEHQLN